MGTEVDVGEGCEEGAEGAGEGACGVEEAEVAALGAFGRVEGDQAGEAGDGQGYCKGEEGGSEDKEGLDKGECNG